MNEQPTTGEEDLATGEEDLVDDAGAPATLDDELADEHPEPDSRITPEPPPS